MKRVVAHSPPRLCPAFAPASSSFPVSNAATMEAGDAPASLSTQIASKSHLERTAEAPCELSGGGGLKSSFCSSTLPLSSFSSLHSPNLHSSLTTGRPHQARHRHEGHRPHGLARTGTKKEKETDDSSTLIDDLSSSRRRRRCSRRLCLPSSAASLASASPPLLLPSRRRPRLLE